MGGPALSGTALRSAGLRWGRGTHCADGQSDIDARCARPPQPRTSQAPPGAPPDAAPAPFRPAGGAARPLVTCHRRGVSPHRSRTTSRQTTSEAIRDEPVAGRATSGASRTHRGEVGTRSVLCKLTCCGCLNGADEVRAVSSTAPPRPEHRRAVRRVAVDRHHRSPASHWRLPASRSPTKRLNQALPWLATAAAALAIDSASPR